ncbi:hypothetical protein [Mesorhizobium sp.]|jgi:hypothetical protein|uniref:hypothetical protein n=1 Tax=Mesorhizobium sp. TaxID=1871066 RepID=UPI003564E1F7
MVIWRLLNTGLPHNHPAFMVAGGIDRSGSRRSECVLPTRFECLQETSGRWMVWDHKSGEPAKLGGIELRNQDKHRCETARDILKRIFQTGLHADAVRRG